MIALAAGGFALGAITGSFLAAVASRWPRGRSILAGRSRCDHCDSVLGAVDLVPLLSYLFLRGRCRRCGAKIDPRHFAIELAAAWIGLVAALAHPLPLAAASAVLGWWLLLIAALDLDHHWLPDRLTLPLIPAGLGVALLGLGPPVGERLIGFAAGYLLLLLIALAYRGVRGREGLGGGDPKLLGALGAWLGWQQLPFVLLGAGLVGLASVLLSALRGGNV